MEIKQQQTAVEWLDSNLNVLVPKSLIIDLVYKDLINKANELEKLKMMEFANWCRVYENNHKNEINTIQQLYSKYIQDV
jgi:hypothetical protein